MVFGNDLSCAPRWRRRSHRLLVCAPLAAA